MPQLGMVLELALGVLKPRLPPGLSLLALPQLMIILGCKRAGEREAHLPSSLTWLHLRYVSSLGVPCFNVVALLWGTWGGGAGSRGLESQMDKQPVPLGSWGQTYGLQGLSKCELGYNRPLWFGASYVSRPYNNIPGKQASSSS